MEPSRAPIQTTPCASRQVRWSFPTVDCPSCGVPAPRRWDAMRVAVDIDLDHPVVLTVSVGVHVCPVCSRMFRAQPPFLRPRAIYTPRVVQKAVEAVYHDGLAMRCVADRLARDFWIKPDEKMVRLWRRTYAAEIDFAVDYQPWVIAHFSGILCVDEVYQGDLALLPAIDPAAPGGDRLVGYTLLPKTKEVDQGMVKTFLERLRAAGVEPEEVITDDSRLYPAALADVWPMAMHQLCLFHATRRVVRAVSEVVKYVRRALPTPPPASKPTMLGTLRRTPPAADQHDPDSERYRWRLARRTLGIAQAQALHQYISSARAIGRQLGVNHGTVRQWLKLTPPDAATIAELSATPDALPVVEPPPLPWRDWDEVRRVREDVWGSRTLFLHQTDNLTTEEQHKLAELLASPVGHDLRVARTFLEAWFAIWQDDLGQRRTPPLRPTSLPLQVRWQRPSTAGEFIAVGPVQHDFLNSSTSYSSRAADLLDRDPTEDDV